MTETTRYLLAVYIAEQRDSPPVQSGAVAEHLDRSAAATTEKLQRLADSGLLTYEPYKGATLTEKGRTRAAEIHTNYVVLSWFFREVLDLETYELEAMKIAGTVSSDVIERLGTLLGQQVEEDIDAPTDPLPPIGVESQ